MVDAGHTRVSIALLVALVLAPGTRGAGADVQKTTSQPTASTLPPGAVRIPAWARAPLDEATKAADRQDWATTEQRFAEVLQKAPGLTPLRFSYAESLARVGKTAEACQ
jgi:hypothetical protein